MRQFRYDGAKALAFAQRIIKSQTDSQELLRIADELRDYATGMDAGAAASAPAAPAATMDSRTVFRGDEDYDPRKRMESERGKSFASGGRK